MRIVSRDSELDEAFSTYTAAKADADRAINALEEAERKLLGLMQFKHRKTISQSAEGHTFTATYTQRTTTSINEKGLRKALTARVFDQYTVKKLDRKALEQAMTDGVVDPTVVAQHVEQIPGKVFLTYRVKEDKVEESEGS